MFGVSPVSRHWTKRPLNACRRCGYTWYPRGKNVSYSCPRCGSGEVELPIMALFRAIGALFVAMAHCVKFAIRLVIGVVVWVGQQAKRLATAIRTCFASHTGTRRTVPPGAPGLSPRASLSTPGPARTGEGWASRALSATRRSAGGFFSWVASVNDDITGVNDSPSAFGVIAKLLVILALAGSIFAFAFLACRGLGLV
jgi:hypothetical protein